MLFDPPLTITNMKPSIRFRNKGMDSLNSLEYNLN